MPIAFKEWAVTVRALAEGEQLLTLRKGGIREPDKHFKLEYDRFFLYPTFDHQCADLVRESHQPELARALEEGVWSDGEPSPHALRRGTEIPQPDRVRIRAWAEVAAHYTITDRRTVDALSPFYVWTTDDADRVLYSLERTREYLAAYFPRTVEGISVVFHPSVSSLAIARPRLPLSWMAASPAGRRYVAGCWAGPHEMHVLLPDALQARASTVPGSREMLERAVPALYARR